MSQPSRTTATRADQGTPAVPKSVVLAVRLMYAGAVLTAAGIVINVLVLVVGGIKELKRTYPHQSATQLHHTLTSLITGVVFTGLIEVGIWLLMARANRGGLSWARIAASVLFALSTWTLISRFHSPIQVVSLIYTAAIWVAGGGAILLLWRPESNAYFSEAMARTRADRAGAGAAGRSGAGAPGRSGPAPKAGTTASGSKAVGAGPGSKATASPKPSAAKTSDSSPKPARNPRKGPAHR